MMSRIKKINFKNIVSRLCISVLALTVALSCFVCSANDVNPDMTNITKTFQTDYQGNGYMFNYLRNGLSYSSTFKYRPGNNNVYGENYWAKGINNYRFVTHRDITASNYNTIQNPETDYCALTYDYTLADGYNFRQFGINTLNNGLALFNRIDIPFTFYNFHYPLRNFNGDVINSVHMELFKVNMFVTYTISTTEDVLWARKYTIKNEYQYNEFTLNDSTSSFYDSNFTNNYTGTLSCSINKPVCLIGIKLEFLFQLSFSEPLTSNMWSSIVQADKDDIAYGTRVYLELGQYNKIYGYSNKSLALMYGKISNDDIFADFSVDPDINNILNSNSVGSLSAFYNNNVTAVRFIGSLFTRFDGYEFFSSIFVLLGSFAIISAVLGVGLSLFKKGRD